MPIISSMRAMSNIQRNLILSWMRIIGSPIVSELSPSVPAPSLPRPVLNSTSSKMPLRLGSHVPVGGIVGLPARLHDVVLLAVGVEVRPVITQSIGS